MEPQLSNQQRAQIRRILEEVQAKTRSPRTRIQLSREEEQALWNKLEEERLIALDDQRNEHFQRTMMASVGLDWEEYKHLPRDGDGYLIFPDKEET